MKKETNDKKALESAMVENSRLVASDGSVFSVSARYIIPDIIICRGYTFANCQRIANNCAFVFQRIMSRAEVDLQISVKKACNSEEVPPKRKHVRACIVYTWDHKNSRAFWNAVKIQPLQSSEVQLFKALIMIHKILQEGHPNTLKDAYRNKDFLYSLSTVFSSSSSYGRLINHYDRFLMRKLDFHRNNQGFNGIFEYEEYISLRTVNDPNEGYESILQLMDLQDLINDLQKLIFSTIQQTPNNLCKTSALVPLISESYGIYKFLTSMLRAMYQQLGDDELLTALFDRFNSQHFYLREFYADCQAIKFLTSLITIPRIPASPPNLKHSDDSQSRTSAIASQESSSALSAQQTSAFEQPLVPPAADDMSQAKLMEQQQQQQQFLQQQEQELEIQRQRQLQEQLQRRREFEQQKLAQEENNLREQEMLRLQQTSAQNSRVSELENDLVIFKNQFDNDQALLHQYDSRVKSLETELQSINQTASEQLASKDEQINNIEEQVTNWAKKYEALAKLYSQLRSEHLNLLAKFKKIQQKINSAQESIAKKEKFEKELKQKNLELADLIRERDRARLDLDRLRVSKDQEIDKLHTQLREMTSRFADTDEVSSQKLQAIKDQYEADLSAMNVLLKERDTQLVQLGEVSSLKEKLKEKEVDLEIAQESLDSALKELSLTSSDPRLEHLWNLLNIILANNVRRVQDTKYELTSPMQTGNVNSTPNFVLSVLDLCSDTATDFALVFNNFLAEGPQLSENEQLSFTGVILASSELASSLNDLMLNIKGLSKTIPPSDEQRIIEHLEELLSRAEDYYLSLTSDSLDALEDDYEKIDLVVDSNVQFQSTLKDLSNAIEEIQPRHNLSNKRKNLEDVVEEEMEEAVKQIDAAMQFLDKLQSQKTEGADMQVHQAIVNAAMGVTQAVTILIKASIDSQREIVAKNKGTLTVREFYKKNNRWTEGLVSAAKAIAGATNILIETADGVLRSKHSHEELIVACNEVAASTAQLVAASRVKANTFSSTQERLETSSTKVNLACKYLVGKVQGLLSNSSKSEPDIDLSTLTPYEGKTLEMEQQVQILKLENSLQSARKRLAEIRKFGYRDDESD